jgi:tetratricopeptide (TPR) repeat protein
MAAKNKTPDPSRYAQPVPPSPSEAPAAADPVGKRLFFAGAAVLFVLCLVLYVGTMEPSSPFWDSGEFIASAYILGIPHAPCTPLYVLVGRVFTVLPLPFSIAGRVNFISALTAALGVLFVYLLAVRLLDAILGRSRTTLDTVIKLAGALVGSLFLAFSHTYWINAIEAEVYALSAFFMGFILWLSLKWAENPTGGKAVGYIYLLFYLLALSVGFHLGTVLVFSGIFCLVLMTKPKTFTNFEFFIACGGLAIFMADATIYRHGGFTLGVLVVFLSVLAWYTYAKKSMFALACTGLFALGLSVHLFLLIRAGHDPIINEGDPSTWKSLYFALRREQYPPPNVLIRKADFGFQLKHFNGYFQQQFQMFTAYLGQLNVGSVVPLALGIWGIVDHYTKHRKTFVMLGVILLVMSLGLVVYLNFSDSEVRERDYFYSPVFYFFAVFIAIGAGSVLSEIRNLAARRNMTGTLPVAVPVAVFLALPFFTLANHHFSHDRSKNYICQKYARNMLVGLEPNAILYTNGDNDTFPLWYIQEVEKYRRDVRVVNLSLLNTPWYIEQLRDLEPKIAISWTNEEIERLRPIETKDGWVLIRDIAVQHILKNNSKNRPMYFAVTIPPETFAPYREFLEMEGLAFRVVPRKGKNLVNVEKLEDNIWNKFDYGGILDKDRKRDDSLYREEYVRRLIQNYAAAFTQLGFEKGRRDDFEGAVKNLNVALEITPDLDPALLWLGWYKLEAGDTAGAVRFYKDEIERRPRNAELLYRLAGVYERIGHLDSALVAVDELIRRDPGHRDAMMSGVGISLRFGLKDKAEKYLSDWLVGHPTDVSVRRALEELREKSAEPQGEGAAADGADSVPRGN